MSPPLPRAIVLAAGLGTRLDPITRVCAKPAVPVAGRPLVCRVLEWLARRHVRDIVLNLHYKPETIARCVGYGDSLGVAVRYSWEPAILGSAGGPRKALDLLGPTFFIINGDTLTDIDLEGMMRAHAASGAAVTLAVMPNPAPERYGGATVDPHGWVQGFAPAGSSAPLHFVGVQLVEAAVFAHLPWDQPAATIGGIYDTLLSERPRGIRAHVVDARFHDIGTPADYLATSLEIAVAEGQAALPIGERSLVDPTATVTRTAVWNDVVIGAGCRLTECIVTDGVVLPPRSAFAREAIVCTAGRAPYGTERRLDDLLLTPLDAPSSRK